MAQEAAIAGVAYGKLHRLSARNESFSHAIGESLLSYEPANRKSAPRCRGQAKILEIDETGVTAKFQSQPSKAATYCVRSKDEGKM